MTSQVWNRIIESYISQAVRELRSYQFLITTLLSVSVIIAHDSASFPIILYTFQNKTYYPTCVEIRLFFILIIIPYILDLLYH